MSFAVAAVGALACLLAFAGCGYTLFAARRVSRYSVSPALQPKGRPRVAVFKPLHGLEPMLEPDLRSFLDQDYEGPVHVWMGLQDPADGARPLAESLAAEPHGRATLVLDDRAHGANAKIANLLNIAAAAEHAREEPADVVVLSDSDIAVRPDYLRDLVAALEAPGVGVVTCLYFGRASRPGRWATASAMGVSYNFLPQAVVGVVAGARPCMGSTIALTSETLARIGGFDRFRDVLADDYELGREVQALGLEVVSPPLLVAHGCAEVTLGEVWRHELRWAKTILGLNPAGHAATLITYPMPLALLGCALLAASAPAMLPPAVLTLLVALACRLWLKVCVDRAAGAASGRWWWLPFRDMMSFVVFVAAYFTGQVDWRGARFHVGRDGQLTPVGDS